MTNNDLFEIKGKKLIRFKGDDTVTEVSVPDGVTTITMNAFEKKNALRRICFPDSVTTIEGDPYVRKETFLFAGCRDSLETIRISNNMETIPDPVLADIPHLRFNEYENGLYVGNESNPYVYFVGVKNKDVVHLNVAEGTRIVCGGILRGCNAIRSVRLPESIVRIENYLWGLEYYDYETDIDSRNALEMNLPKMYLRRKTELPVYVLHDLMTTVWKDKIPNEDYVWVYLFQSAKMLDELCVSKMEKDPDGIVSTMLSILAEKTKPSAYRKAVKFAYQYKEKIDPERIAAMCELATAAKVKTEEFTLLLSYAEKTQVVVPTKKDPTEQYCLEHFSYEEVEDSIKKAGFSFGVVLKRYPVLYRDKTETPAFVVKCALYPYLDAMKGSYPKAMIIQDADDLVAGFDPGSFNLFLKKITEKAMRNLIEEDRNQDRGVEAGDRPLALVGRYGDSEMIRALIAGYDYRRKHYKGNQRTALVCNYERYIQTALLLSDSIEACAYCKEQGWLYRYASIRGKKPYEFESPDTAKAEKEQSVSLAIAIYEDCVTRIEEILNVDRTFNEPIVCEAPRMLPVNHEKPEVEVFFNTIIGHYKASSTRGSYDWQYSLDELQALWDRNSRVEKGDVGVCYAVGKLVAGYMFGELPISGNLMFCRDKWEYRGDYSSATRLCISCTGDYSDWKIYLKPGFPERDM